MDNFYFNFGPNGNEASAPVVVTKNNTTYGLTFSFTETHVFGEFSQAQQNALSSFEYAQPFRSRLFQQRLADNDFKGMYAFDAPNLSITTTPNGGTASQVKFNNFASVFVADLFGSNPPEDYKVSIESPYRGDENAEATSIVFGTGEDEQSLLISTLKDDGNGRFVSGDVVQISNIKRLVRERTPSGTVLSCPDGYSIGFSAIADAPLVAGLQFLDNTNDENTVRIFVDEDNDQSSRIPSVAISTMSTDESCGPDNGPTRFIPLPGLGEVSYPDPSNPPQV
ncbi:hypothetical protein GCM10011362_18560 [Marinobacter halophilus]|nr:hypothetical protein GCM10011362_18560 [Marinobacter halophilus]